MDWDSRFENTHFDLDRYTFSTSKEPRTVLKSTKRTGSYSVVYECYDENGKQICIKIMKQQDTEDDVQLFSEYTIHKRLWDTHGRHMIEPLWLKWIMINDNTPVLAMGLQRFECTLYQWLRTNKAPELKKTIVQELKTLNKLGFYHRDLHLGNIGMIGDKWFMFDFGMALFDDMQPYISSDAFYRKKITPSKDHDARIFLFSWSNNVEYDEKYMNAELKKIKTSDCKHWEPNMPVLCDGKKAVFLDEEMGYPIISVLNGRKRKRVSVPRDSIEPDTTYEFIQYFTPLL